MVLRCNNGEHLQKEDKIKYLGMLIDSELTFRPHTLVLVSFIVQGIVLHLKSERDSSPRLFYQSLVMLRVRFVGGEGGDFPPSGLHVLPSAELFFIPSGNKIYPPPPKAFSPLHCNY